MKKINYWTIAEDNLCHEWVAATEQREQSRIYTKLHPKILTMVESILRRYFNTTQNDADKISDVIQHVFIRMHRYDETKKGKNGWYSFIQTVAKNMIYELDDTYRSNRYETLKNTNQLLHLDNPDYNFDIRDGIYSTAVEIEKLREEAVIKFENEINFLKKEYENLVIERKEIDKLPTNESTTYFNKKVNYLELAIEYINGFSAYSVISLNVYILNNNTTNMTVNGIFTLTQKYFNKCARNGADITTDKATRVQDQYPFIQDDYPSSNYYVKHKITPAKSKRRKLLRDKNVTKYLYF